jgi:hypothetical protein
MATADIQVDIAVTIPRDFLMSQRRALLMQLDALERLLGVSPLTSEIRRERREATHAAQPGNGHTATVPQSIDS